VIEKLSNKPVAENKYVRTDSTATTLDAFLNQPSNDDMDTDESRVHVNLGSIHTLRKRFAKEENQGNLK
jgi:hypothetical protein